ncbi:outer membrane protein [Saltatorellus ferox]
MRVSTKALAPLPLLLFFASCVTPPPMAGPMAERGRSVADGSGARYQESDRSYREQRDQPERASWYDRRDDDRVADSRRDDDRRFDDGRYSLRSAGRPTPMSAAYEPASYEPGVTAASAQRRRDPGYYDSGYVDPIPPHERGNYSAPANGRISFLFGRRDLLDDSIVAAERMYAFGVEFAQAVEPGTLGFEFGFHFAGDEEDNVSLPPSANFTGGIFNVERDMAEVSAGVRAEFSRSNVRPYIGGGGTLINMSERRAQGFLEAEDDDSTVGFYLHGGVQFDLSDVLFLGLDFRRVFGSQVDLFDDTYDTDYGQLSFVLGLSL